MQIRAMVEVKFYVRLGFRSRFRVRSFGAPADEVRQLPIQIKAMQVQV